ncbi:collagen binding domain-containing protein [Colwelliaceae bacterium 6441]
MKFVRFYISALIVLVLSACGGGGGDTPKKGVEPQPTKTYFSVTTKATTGGSISPTSVEVEKGKTTSFNLTTNEGYIISEVSGCDGTLAGNIYTTGNISAACEVRATFQLKNYSVLAISGEGGDVSPAEQIIVHGQKATLSITANTGFKIDEVTGCDGSLTGSIYTTAVISDDCQVNATFSLLAIPDHFDDSKKVLLSDNSEYVFFSLLPLSESTEQMQFNAITHLQYLLAVSGVEFSQTEEKIRQYFNLFTSPYLALIPPIELHDINDVIFDLSIANMESFDTTLNRIYEEIVSNEWQHLRERVALQHKFDINNNEVVITKGESAEVSIELPFLSPLNENYTIVWSQGSWETVESSNQKMVVKLSEGINQPVHASIKNTALNANVYTIFGALESYSTEVVSPEFIEGAERYAVSHGLEINQADYEQSKDSWQPTVIHQNASDKLVTLELDGLNNSATFSYRYDPKLTPNPKELKFTLVIDGDEQLLTPSLIDLDNLTVTLFIPAVAESAKAISATTMMTNSSSTSSSKRLLHVEVVRGAPDGHDIASLLEGKREYLEKAITMLFTADNQKLTTQSALNRFVAPLYSDNDTERRLARAKLTKLLSTKTDGSYKAYQEFTAALNIAVAGQVLSDINWDVGSEKILGDWFSRCVYVALIDRSALCENKLYQAYKYAPKLMNEGISAFVGASSLSKAQQSHMAIFKGIISVAGASATGAVKLDTELLVGTSLAALAPDTINTLYSLGTSAYQFIQGAKSVSTIGVSLTVGYIGGKMVAFVEKGTKAKNVWAYTPLIYAMKANKGNLFNSVLIVPQQNRAGEANAWWPEDFTKDFLSSEPFSKLSRELKGPQKTFFGWKSQFGPVLDPGRRLESMFLHPNPLPEDWDAEYLIDGENRYLALKFMDAAFGNEQASAEIKAYGDVSLLFSVAPTLVQAQTVSINDITKMGNILYTGGLRRLEIKSQYVDDSVYVCSLFPTRYGTYIYGPNCLNSSNAQSNKKQLNSYRASKSSNGPSYVSDFDNVNGGELLFSQMGLHIPKDLFDKLTAAQFEFVDFEVLIRGHNLTINGNVAEVAGQREGLQLNSGQFTFDDFTFNEQTQKYNLSLNSLFPELTNTDFDNSVLAIGLKLVVNLSGKNHSLTALKAYTTVTDESVIIDDTLETADISGLLESNGNPIAGKSVRLEPLGTIKLTDNNGKFTFSSVPEGNYQLVVVTELESVKITLGDISNSDVKVTVDILNTTNENRVTGKLEGNDGPLALKPVKLEPIGVIEFTDRYGKFTFSSVPEGSYQLHVMNYESQSSFITLDDISNNNVEVTIEVENFESPFNPELQTILKLQREKGPSAIFSIDCITLNTLAGISYCTDSQEILYSVYSTYSGSDPLDFSQETRNLREMQSNRGYASIMSVECRNLLEQDAIDYCNTEQELIIWLREIN